MNSNAVIEDLLDPARSLTAVRLSALSDLDAAGQLQLKMALARTDVDRRLHLAHQLIDLGENDAALNFEPVFTLLLQDADAEIRRLAIDGLWEYEDRSIIAPLIRMLESDPDAEVRAAAALALGRFVVLNEFESIRPSDGQKVLDALQRVIDDPTEPLEVRRRAVEALGASSDPGTDDMIWRAFDDVEPLMQVSALHAMGRNGDPDWLPTLYAEMESGDPQRRFEAAVAAGRIGDDDAVPQLVGLFEDADPEVQEAAVAAVGEIGGDVAADALRDAMPGDEPRMTAALRAALNQALAGEGLLAPDAFDADLDDDEDIEEDADENDDE